MTAKTCRDCGETKALEEFSRYSRASDGRDSKCLLCRRAYQNARNAAKVNGRVCAECGVRKPAAGFAAHPHETRCVTCRLAIGVKHCAGCHVPRPLDAFHRLDSAADGRQSNCASCRADIWALTELDDRQRAKRMAAVRLSVARAHGVIVIPFTVEELEARLSMFAGCWMCGGEATEVDHVKPLAAGGAHCLSNLRPACRSCNASKGSKWPFVIEEVAA